MDTMATAVLGREWELHEHLQEGGRREGGTREKEERRRRRSNHQSGWLSTGHAEDSVLTQEPWAHRRAISRSFTAGPDLYL